jgi:hypothetical protein
VWSYDFVAAMTHDGRSLGLLTLVDENLQYNFDELGLDGLIAIGGEDTLSVAYAAFASPEGDLWVGVAGGGDLIA